MLLQKLRKSGFWVCAGKTGLAGCLLASACFGAPAPSIPPKRPVYSALPSVSSVFDHYIQATGGRSAWRSKQVERTQIEGRPLDGARVILRAAVTTTRTGNSMTEMTIPEVASEGVYKGVAWSWTKLAGPRIRKGPERASAVRGTHMLEEGDWRSLYPNSKIDGAEPVAGKMCYRVSLLPSNDGKMEWFELDSGLLVKKSWWEASTAGPVAVSSTVEQWREVEGLWQPMMMLVDRGEMKYRVTVLSVAYDTEAKAEALRYPQEVATYLAEDRAGRALPNAEEVIERHIYESGGAASYQTLRTQRISGTLDYLTRGMVAHTEAYSAPGGRYYQAVDIPGLGKQEEGSDGSVMWERSPALGPRAKTRRALTGLGVTMDAAEVIGWRYLIGQARTEALEKLDGRDCYRVRLTGKNGGAATVRWYEKASGLLYRQSVSFKTEMGDVPAVLTYEEWRRVEGLKWPVKIRIAAAGQELLFAADQVALNSLIENDVFAVPDDVKKLAEAHAERAAPVAGDMQ